MGKIDVEPGQVEATGQAIVTLAPTATQVGQAAQAVGGRVDDPIQTSVALSSLSTQWAAGAAALEQELLSLGNAARAAAFLYRLTDATAIPFSPP